MGAALWLLISGCPSGGSWEAQVAFPAVLVVENAGPGVVDLEGIVGSRASRSLSFVRGARLGPGARIQTRMSRGEYEDVRNLAFLVFASCNGSPRFVVRGHPSMVSWRDPRRAMRVKVSLRLCGDAASGTVGPSDGEAPDGRDASRN